MRITLKNTITYKGHKYKAGVLYGVTNELGKNLLEKDEKKVNKNNNKNKEKWQ